MGEVRSILGAKMGQTMRHSMPIYAIAHMDGRTKEGTQTLILWGLGAFFWSYCSTIGGVLVLRGFVVPRVPFVS
jgi:hypothetical protein